MFLLERERERIYNSSIDTWIIPRLGWNFVLIILDRKRTRGDIEYFFQLSDAVGMMGVFIIFGVSALLEAVFIYLALPETKDRALQEIEDYFQVRKFPRETKCKAYWLVERFRRQCAYRNCVFAAKQSTMGNQDTREERERARDYERRLNISHLPDRVRVCM